MTTNTTNLFYTDPLAAAWMAKHFGMEFRFWRWNDLSFQFLPTGRNKNPDHSRLYIQPESLPLLKPKEWDIGQRLQGVPVVVCTPENYEEFRKHGLSRNYVAFGDSLLDDYFRIRQRNGLAFHWPEREAE